MELEYFNSKGVWAKWPRRLAKQRTGKGPISVRWVDVNKGDDLNPKYRSRLVARQLKAHGRELLCPNTAIGGFEDSGLICRIGGR